MLEVKSWKEIDRCLDLTSITLAEEDSYLMLVDGLYLGIGTVGKPQDFEAEVWSRF